ncbi:MAG: hypothetical protein ACREOF_03190 [Gemmatimonadales bacterium]
MTRSASEPSLVARKPAEFASLVLGLLEDRERRLRLGLAAREAVARVHSWSGAASELTGLLHGSTAGVPANTVDGAAG